MEDPDDLLLRTGTLAFIRADGVELGCAIVIRPISRDYLERMERDPDGIKLAAMKACAMIPVRHRMFRYDLMTREWRDRIDGPVPAGTVVFLEVSIADAEPIHVAWLCIKELTISRAHEMLQSYIERVDYGSMGEHLRFPISKSIITTTKGDHDA